MKPKRIQRKRTAGWKMPENTVYVGRPTKWGNPFPVGSKIYNLPSIVSIRMNFTDDELAAGVLDNCASKVAFRIWLNHIDVGKILATDARTQLKGKDLDCWCKPNECCHADTLLSIANS